MTIMYRRQIMITLNSGCSKGKVHIYITRNGTEQNLKQLMCSAHMNSRQYLNIGIELEHNSLSAILYILRQTICELAQHTASSHIVYEGDQS